MDTDEEFAVVIVVNDDDDNEEISSILSNVKTEPLENDEELLQSILEVPLQETQSIKEEPVYYIDDDDDDENELDESIYDDTAVSTATDTEYIPNEEEDEYYFDKNNKLKKKTKCRRPDPATWVSFVAQLVKRNPHLKENKKALILALVEHMQAVKAPKIEGSFYDKGTTCQYMCKICFYEQNHKPAMDRHFLEKHGPRYLHCFACGSDFRSTTNLYKHEKRCMADDAQIVLQARAIYLGAKARGRPFIPKQNLVKNKGKRFKCSLCPAAFKVKMSLISHERMHRAERPFQCNLCPSAYTSKSVLWKHMWTHSDASFICDHCGIAFKYKTALASHVYTHFAPRFACSECDRRFTYKAALQLHVHRKHRNLPLPCACQICPKRFGRMWSLKDHMKKAHGMLLMTRTMFFKRLPTISDTEIDQAKVVMRSEVPIINPSDVEALSDRIVKQKTEFNEEFLDEEDEEDLEEESDQSTYLNYETGQLVFK